MSDSSSSGSERSVRVTKKAPPKSASKKAPAKSAPKSATSTKKLKAGTKIGTTTIGKALHLLPVLTNSYKKERARATRRHRREHSGSNNGLTMAQIKKKEAEQKATMFRRLGRKVGHELGIKERRIVLNEINAASVSGEANVNAVVHKLKLLPVKNEIKEFAKKERERKRHNASFRKAQKKEVGRFEALAGKNFNTIEKAILKNEATHGTKGDREAGKREYESRKARVATEKDDLEKRIKLAKKVVKDDFVRFYKSIDSNKAPSESDILAVATLAAHGFDVMPGEHRYLKRHLVDDTTDAIRKRLLNQLFEEGVEACDACVMEQYIKTT